MLARCARCQNNFTTEKFGLQRCPHCDSELILADPGAPVPPGGPPAELPPLPGEPPGAQGFAGGGALPPVPPGGGFPPPPGPPGGGFAPPPGGWPPPGGGFGPPPGGPPGGELPAPFADRKRLGFFAAYFETWKLVATKPQEFFRRVRVDQTGSAVLFGVLSFTAGSIAAALYSAVSSAGTLRAMQEMMGNMPPEQAAFMEKLIPYMTGGATLWNVLAAPIGALLSIYIAAAVFHLLLLLFRGAPRGFGATLTTVAYAHALALLLAVPICGSLVAMVWMVVVFIMGLAESQRCGTGKAAAAVLLPAVLGACCCCGSAVVGTFGLIKAFSGSGAGNSLEL